MSRLLFLPDGLAPSGWGAVRWWGARAREQAPWRDGVLLATLAVALRVALVFLYGADVPPAADGSFYHVVGERIARGEGYTWAWPDGVVTYAAHYPVGYAGLLGLVYLVGGPVPQLAMLMNAIIGAGAVLATHRLAARWVGRGPAIVAASLVGLSPTLMGYTLALMTEGVVATGWIGATWCAALAGESAPSSPRRWKYGLALGLVMGATTLVRPQSLLLAPVLGWIAAGDARVLRRVVWGVAVSALAVGVCLPWTLRNCERMDRCVMVSANGGWNLLIGTFPEGQGAWVPITGERVPEACREVFEEAAKDECFGREARRRIVENPVEWARLVPAKLQSTFDFTASANAYFEEAGAPWGNNPQLVRAEIAGRRVLVALALIGAWRLGRRPAGGEGSRAPAGPWRRGVRWLRALLMGGGLLGLLGSLAWLSHLIFVALGLTARQVWTRPLLLAACAAVAATSLVHGVFFGAGRYSMVLEPLLAVVAAAALAGRGGRAADSGRILTGSTAAGDTSLRSQSACP